MCEEGVVGEVLVVFGGGLVEDLTSRPSNDRPVVVCESRSGGRGGRRRGGGGG